MRLLGMAALAVAMLASPAWAQQKPVTAQISAGGMPFEVGVPDGYCVSGEGMRAGRPDLELVKCGDTLREHDFYSVKATSNLDGSTGPTTRAALFAGLKPMFEGPASEALFAAINDKAKRAQNLDLEGAWKPMGMDDTCAYMGAQVTIDVGTGPEKWVQGICITVIGGKTFAIYSSGRGGTIEDLAQRIEAVRKLALVIRPVTVK